MCMCVRGIDYTSVPKNVLRFYFGSVLEVLYLFFVFQFLCYILQRDSV